MNSPAYDLLTYFVTEQSTYIAGTNAFVGIMPEEPDVCVTFYDYAGGTPNPKWLIDYPVVRCVARGEKRNYNSGYILADLVKDTILGIGGIEINSMHYSGVNMERDINYEGYDENNRAGFTLSFYVTREPNSSQNRLPL